MPAAARAQASAVERRAYEAFRRSLVAQDYEVGPLRHRGADCAVRRCSAARANARALRVEIKAAETPCGRQWQWSAKGTSANGRPLSLLSQCRVSGAEVLLLVWKPQGGQRLFLVLHLPRLLQRQARALQVLTLKRSIDNLEREFGKSAVSTAGLPAQLAALLPA